MSKTNNNIEKYDERGVRKQVYKRYKEGEDFLPVEADETRAMIEMVKRQFTNPNVRKRKKYVHLEDFRAVIVEYFDYIGDSNDAGSNLIPDVEGFCTFAGISRETLNDWQRSRPGEFSETIGDLKNAIASCKKQLALKGKIPPIVFATDFNNNHGYTQKQTVEIQPVNPLGDNLTPEEIEKRIPKSIPEDIPIDTEFSEEE
ncbi:MAG: hypothetical protein E7215_16865 [Clostridium sulfidigenes]|uniref:Uncharacterized protein n=1 Tax=Clostridium sulfidigenes TaxID=318464 RepID=A0A927ZV93_9CLOT|nr:hypothetical protein [Clostridium sulfidigenes]